MICPVRSVALSLVSKLSTVDKMYWSRIIDIAGVALMTILAGLVGFLALIEGGPGTGIILIGAAACVIGGAIILIDLTYKQ